MKKLLFLIPLVFIGCAPVYLPPSLLLGSTYYFGAPYEQGNVSASLAFDQSGTFIYEESWPNNCSSSGTWSDLNPGATEGRVQLAYNSDTCNSPPLVNTTQSYLYTMAGNNFTINLILGGVYTQLSD